MTKKKFYKKAVVSSVFVVSIMCLASTAVPALNSKNVNTIIRNTRIIRNENIEELILELLPDKEEISLSDLISNIKSKNSDLSKDYHSLEFILKYLEQKFSEQFNIIPKKEFESYLHNILLDKQNDLKAIIKEFQRIRNNIDLLDPKNECYTLPIENEEKVYRQSIEDNGFDAYWMNYEKCLAFWHTDYDNIIKGESEELKKQSLRPVGKHFTFNDDNYYSWVTSYFKELGPISFRLGSYYTAGIILLFLGGYFLEDFPPGGLTITTIGLFFLALASYILQGYLAYIFWGNIEFARLANKEINLHLRVLKNVTTGDSYVHQPLKNSFNVKALNTNADDECDDTGGQEKDRPDNAGRFKYTLYYNENFNGNEEGWYSLTDDAVEFSNRYQNNPPAPPGNWTITIDERGYEIETRTISLLASESKIFAEEIILKETT